MKFLIDRQPMWNGRMFDVRMFCDPRNGETERIGDQYVSGPTVVKSLVLEKADDGMVVAPSFTISEAEAQQLCDALFDAGIRPTSGAGSVGQLAATEKHLSDLKTIAFHALKISSNVAIDRATGGDGK